MLTIGPEICHVDRCPHGCTPATGCCGHAVRLRNAQYDPWFVPLPAAKDAPCPHIRGEHGSQWCALAQAAPVEGVPAEASTEKLQPWQVAGLRVEQDYAERGLFIAALQSVGITSLPERVEGRTFLHSEDEAAYYGWRLSKGIIRAPANGVAVPGDTSQQVQVSAEEDAVLRGAVRRTAKVVCNSSADIGAQPHAGEAG